MKKRPFKKPQIQDARQKLIQKKRNHVKDARDILAKIAKGQDARNRLNKIRQSTNGNIKVIGSNILQKTDRDGNICLVTNKAKVQSPTGMNITIQKELGLITSQKKALVRRSLNAPRVSPSVRQAVLNEIDPYNQIVARSYDPSLYKWSKPGLRASASQLIGSLEVRKRSSQWQNFPVTK